MLQQHRGVVMRPQTYRLQIVWPLFPFTDHREPNFSIKMARHLWNACMCWKCTARYDGGFKSAWRPKLPSLNLSGGWSLPGHSSPCQFILRRSNNGLMLAKYSVWWSPFYIIFSLNYCLMLASKIIMGVLTWQHLVWLVFYFSGPTINFNRKK